MNIDTVFNEFIEKERIAAGLNKCVLAIFDQNDIEELRDKLNAEYVLVPKEPDANLKAALSGVFKIEVEHSCSACAYDMNDPDEEIECEVCGGKITYIRKHVIDWTTIKEIRKAILEASKEQCPEN